MARSCSKTSPFNYCTSQTAQKLAALPNLEYLNDFSLYNVPETFDALSFIEFIKNVYKPKIKDAEVQFYRFILEFKAGIDASFISNFKQIIQSAVSRMKSKENNLLCIIYP
uniref:Uncharacterized protein n=1 Tax=Panagrolaimus davidi TaxID=227884 RepID=A0A914QFN0_9BILA